MADEDSTEFQELLALSHSEDLTDIEACSAIKLCTVPNSAPVLTITPSYLDTSSDLKRVLLLIIRLLNPCLSSTSSSPYHVIYVQSGFSSTFHHLRFLFWAYRVLPRRYKKNLSSLSIIHPTLWVRLFFLAMGPTLRNGFWNKLHYCDGIDELYLDDVVGKAHMEQVLPRIAFEKERERGIESRIRADSIAGESG